MKQIELSNHSEGIVAELRHCSNNFWRYWMLEAPPCIMSLAVIEEGPGALSKEELASAALISVVVGGVISESQVFNGIGMGA